MTGDATGLVSAGAGCGAGWLTTGSGSRRRCRGAETDLGACTVIVGSASLCGAAVTAGTAEGVPTGEGWGEADPGTAWGEGTVMGAGVVTVDGAAPPAVCAAALVGKSDILSPTKPAEANRSRLSQAVPNASGVTIGGASRLLRNCLGLRCLFAITKPHPSPSL
jgi:hypothetical protein